MKTILKNQKSGILSVGILLVSTISLGIFVQSCNSADSIFSNPTAVDRQEANLIASEYVELIGNQYVLNLSEEKALALGISELDYGRIQTEISQANIFIIECQANRIEVAINEPEKIKPDIQKIRLKSGKESESGNDIACSFTMSPTGADGYASAAVPNGAKKVKLTLTSPCTIGSCSGTVACGGVSIPYAIVGISGGSTTVKLPLSNTNMTIRGSTSCPGGGSVSAKFGY
jgi:hypothetical protein